MTHCHIGYQVFHLDSFSALPLYFLSSNGSSIHMSTTDVKITLLIRNAVLLWVCDKCDQQAVCGLLRFLLYVAKI